VGAEVSAWGLGAGVGGGGGLAQPASSRIRANPAWCNARMLVILLEMLLVLGLAVGIVWWTMVSGRKDRAEEDADQ
jgi:hypothetical protein